jgi:predicted dehydrogenase
MVKHRIAVVGCGALARSVHLPSVARSPRAELVATCDIDRAAAEAACREFGASRFETDWRALVRDPGIDLFILATHTELRGELIVPALEAGKPVYTEKPLAPDIDEMIDIVRASRRTGVPVCVGHNRRSSPAVLELARLVGRARAAASSRPSVDRQGERARIPEESTMQLLIRVNDDARSWKDWIFWDREGILFAEMVHFIDLALWLNPSHPVRAMAEGSARGNFTLLLRFADGSLTTLQHTMVGHFDYPKELLELTVNNVTVAMDQHIEVRQCGLEDEPSVRTFPYARGCEWAASPGMAGYFASLDEELSRARAGGRPPRWLNVNKGHAEHLDRFLAHLEGDGENPCGVETAVPVTRVALKLLESARLGLPVAVAPEDWHLPGGPG